jgi:trehalose/maltose hydrolase-like predicted phosphorylase
MAGTVDILTRHYAGLELHRDGVHLAPDMPLGMRRLRFRVEHRGRWFDVELTPARLRVTVDDAEPGEARVRVYGRLHALPPGEALEVELEGRPSPAPRPAAP